MSLYEICWMTTTLVTGGAGFIGSHLVEQLLAEGHQVRVLDDLSTGRAENLAAVQSRIEFLQGSLTDRVCVQKAVADVEWIFHLGALPSVARSVEAPLPTHEVCATGTLNVLDAARSNGVKRLIYAASSSAYGGLPGERRREEDPVAPLSPYAAAKLAGEFYCQCFGSAFGLETVRLRFFNVFGPRQRADSPYSGVVPLFIATLLDGRVPTIHGDGLQSRDFTYVANVVHALLRAAVSPGVAGKVYNIGHGSSTSVLDLCRLIQRILGVQVEPLHTSARPGDARHSLADITHTRQDLGYNPPVGLEEGLRLTVEALRASGR